MFPPHFSSNDFHFLFALSQDTQNLKSRVQKQQVFEEELAANKILLNKLEKTGQEMIEGSHYAADSVATRLAEVASLWEQLLEATAQKGEKQRFC